MGQIFGGHIAAKYMKEVENVKLVFTLSGGHIEIGRASCRERVCPYV